MNYGYWDKDNMNYTKLIKNYVSKYLKKVN